MCTDNFENTGCQINSICIDFHLHGMRSINFDTIIIVIRAKNMEVKKKLTKKKNFIVSAKIEIKIWAKNFDPNKPRFYQSRMTDS